MEDNFEKMINTMQSMLLDYKTGGLTRGTLLSNLECQIQYLDVELKDDMRNYKNGK